MPLNVPSELLYTAGQSLAASEKYRQTDRHSDGISSIAMPTSDRTAEKPSNGRLIRSLQFFDPC
jgi:hypothetical protein